MKKEIVLEDDLYAIQLEGEPDNCYLDFKIHAIAFSDRPHYHDENSDTNETRDKVEDATPFVQGSIKWDGCINYTYPGQSTCMLHQCGVEDFDRINRAFHALYDAAAEAFGDKCDWN